MAQHHRIHHVIRACVLDRYLVSREARWRQAVSSEVADEKGLLGVDLVVDFPYAHVFVLVLNDSIGNVAARLRPGAEEAREGQRLWVRGGFQDVVSVKGRVQSLGRGEAVGLISLEIAGQLGWRGKNGREGRGLRSKQRALVSDEKEYLVLLDRPSERTSKLIAL